MDNIITAVFGAARDTRTQPRYRYNRGQRLQIAGLAGLPDVYEVHIANVGDAEAARVIYSGEPVPIDNKYFETGRDIQAWVYVSNAATDGTTKRTAVIPIINRPMPVDYEPTPEETGIVEQAIELLNHEIADIEDAAQNAQIAQTAAAAAQADAETASQGATQATASAESATQSAQRAEAAADIAERHGYALNIDGTTLVFTSPKEG